MAAVPRTAFLRFLKDHSRRALPTKHPANSARGRVRHPVVNLLPGNSGEAEFASGPEEAGKQYARLDPRKRRYWFRQVVDPGRVDPGNQPDRYSAYRHD